MRIFLLAITLWFLGCTSEIGEYKKTNQPKHITTPTLLILGTLQDGGSPHAGCKKKCCENLFSNSDAKRKVVSLGLVDPVNKHTWLFEATPDFPEQIKKLKQLSGASEENPTGIFITHAHIGHYAGLMYLGREVMNSKSVQVFAMPQMKKFLELNGPWSQLVKLENIRITEITDEADIKLSLNISVKPFRVPHRDEFSETVGYIISGPRKKVLFIPDIDKWQKWDKSIVEEIRKVDYAFIDGTFYDGSEINNRNISEIPHPFVTESMEAFGALDGKEKSKIHFIHFNHTNPLLLEESEATKKVLEQGFKIAKIKQQFEL